MLKKYIVLISTLALLITPHIAQAETYNTVAGSQSAKQLLKTNLQTLKDERQTIVDTKKALMQEFRLKIAAIKDQRKKLLVERIDNRIATANANLTTKMDRALDRMSGFLETIKTRGAARKATGADTTALDAAIANAEIAITNARTAVETQKTKTYTASISGDSTLKSTIGQMVSGFRLDIQAVHKLVVDARQAVMKALSELAKLGGVGNTATGAAGLNQ